MLLHTICLAELSRMVSIILLCFSEVWPRSTIQLMAEWIQLEDSWDNVLLAILFPSCVLLWCNCGRYSSSLSQLLHLISYIDLSGLEWFCNHRPTRPKLMQQQQVGTVYSQCEFFPHKWLYLSGHYVIV